MNKNELLAVLAQICNDAYAIIDLDDKKKASISDFEQLKQLAKQLHEIVSRLHK